ncbi:DUF3298 and DUF4163 domain-containing protein [Paludibaculum fermentans]|uniref:DUF3298 domain-containing protein n=1 Tax=Paludibaculum fermentans TaxID=1473598 RepID=A0A7S7NSS9_PALFE|nr:DUF3298 and DUF4163 domain-containing protein [Paludibaculum fermentans]QOY89068.1 DUF3298 domain-containing protein [Paludibaculum fermentans]
MWKLCFAVLILLYLPAVGCKRAPDAAAPSPLVFAHKKFDKSVPGCGDKVKREEACVTFRVSWVEAASASSDEVKTKINAAILAALQPKEAPRGFDAEAAEVAADYERFHKEFDDSAITYFIRRTADILLSNATMLSIEITEEEFRGGAHPESRRTYLNLDPAKGQDLFLKDIVRDGSLQKLTDLAEKRFRVERAIPDGRKLSESGFTFADDKFALSKTWGVSPNGLVIHYNAYEIAPYAAGPTTIMLPWKEIRDLIRKEAGILPPAS